VYWKVKQANEDITQKKGAKTENADVNDQVLNCALILPQRTNESQD